MQGIFHHQKSLLLPEFCTNYRKEALQAAVDN
jgi:hypothetical protein